MALNAGRSRELGEAVNAGYAKVIDAAPGIDFAKYASQQEAAAPTILDRIAGLEARLEATQDNLHHAHARINALESLVGMTQGIR